MISIFRLCMLALLLLPMGLRADVITPGEVYHKFQVINLDEYPDYRFYIMYQGFYYDRGYQPAEPRLEWIKPDEMAAAGGRGASSRIYAVSRSDSTSVMESEERVGGSEIIKDTEARYIQDFVKITAVKDGKVEFEVVEQKLEYRNGQVKDLKSKKKKKNKKGIMGASVMGIELTYLVLPAVCLLGLVMFFVFRRKVSSTS